MTLQARQGGNLPFNFGGIDLLVMPPKLKGRLLALAGFRCRCQNIDVVADANDYSLYVAVE
ncbi:hypothetical protein [Collinsella aerofaciens]|uniref:Uncharacterized protein n=1 Tax=Collinsella aerofaciens TaxID=74426 RepID=A0A2D1TV39_9ACTN|nr:hypothetical protein [Collinsella aerofaciens]ATP53186.1 hypothetical protein CSV91_00685 [Collinsella aerofaciens]